MRKAFWLNNPVLWCSLIFCLAVAECVARDEVSRPSALLVESGVAQKPRYVPMRQTSLLEATWIEVKDGNDTAREIFDNHYSRYRYADGRKRLLFVGPGEKTVLVTPCARALFVWRKFISMDRQQGVNCAVFRNEGAGLSSDLIRAADAIAWTKSGLRILEHCAVFAPDVDPKRTLGTETLSQSSTQRQVSAAPSRATTEDCSKTKAEGFSS